MARPFRIGATGGLGFSSNPDQSPQLGDGTCRCQSAAGWSRSTTFCNVTGLQVRPNPPALPKLFGTSNQAVDPSEKYQCTGAPLAQREFCSFAERLEASALEESSRKTAIPGHE